MELKQTEETDKYTEVEEFLSDSINQAFKAKAKAESKVEGIKLGDKNLTKVIVKGKNKNYSEVKTFYSILIDNIQHLTTLIKQGVRANNPEGLSQVFDICKIGCESLDKKVVKQGLDLFKLCLIAFEHTIV